MCKSWLILSAFSFLVFSFFSAGCGNEVNKKPSERYNLRVFQMELDEFGYEISEGDQLLIRQTTIPALPDNEGFATAAEAEKAARLVISKLEMGIHLPTITVKELDSLGISTYRR